MPILVQRLYKPHTSFKTVDDMDVMADRMAAKQDSGQADRKQPFDCRGAIVDSTRRAYVQCQEARHQACRLNARHYFFKLRLLFMIFKVFDNRLINFSFVVYRMHPVE